jgi:CubicO group peptidase (beta-lactamase class C family)
MSGGKYAHAVHSVHEFMATMSTSLEEYSHADVPSIVCTAAMVLASLVLSAAPSKGQSTPQTVTWRAPPHGAHGFDAFALADAVDRAADLGPLTSLLVARDTTTVAEVYFNGRGPRDGANLKSASKSVLSALTGIALADGTLDSVHQPIGPFFPRLLADAPRKQRITIHHLLTQQTGLESTSFGNYGAWVASSNWVADALRRPMVDQPGGDMIYSTGTTHVLGTVLAKTTGQSLRAYAQDRLFDPLGVRIRSWQQAPTGRYFGGNNLSLTPRGMLRFGQLYLNDGRFRGEQILPSDWIDRSWRTYVRSTYNDHQYGYLWFTHTFGGEQVAFAWGYGGQYVFVVPRLDLVVVCTSALQNRPRGSGDHNEHLLRLLANHIIPAARGPGLPDLWPAQPFFGFGDR